MRRLWPIAGLILFGAACIEVPTELPPIESTRRATATVDDQGRIITGGNLTLAIPSGAIPAGERIQVTIDEILGAPAQHVNETYLVSPEGYNFLRPIEVRYSYTNHMVEAVTDLSALFVGVASGSDWLGLDSPHNNLDGQLVSGSVAHFSVFGLVDPNASLDAGQADSSAVDAGQVDSSSVDHAISSDASLHDQGASDHVTSSDASTGAGLHFQLTWNGASSDLDLHLMQIDAEPFSDTQDCYYANCKSQFNPLDWPPTGPANNPVMDIDDTNGYGPENINMSNAESGRYSAAVHVFSWGQDVAPVSATLRIYNDSEMVYASTRDVELCGGFYYFADLTVSAGGQTIVVSERNDAPFAAGHPNCP